MKTNNLQPFQHIVFKKLNYTITEKNRFVISQNPFVQQRCMLMKPWKLHATRAKAKTFNMQNDQLIKISH